MVVESRRRYTPFNTMLLGGGLRNRNRRSFASPTINQWRRAHGAEVGKTFSNDDTIIHL